MRAASRLFFAQVEYCDAEIDTVEALGCNSERYTLASLRYDLSKLPAKGLLATLPNSTRSASSS
jgi:hypothetical protein